MVLVAVMAIGFTPAIAQDHHPDHHEPDALAQPHAAPPVPAPAAGDTAGCTDSAGAELDRLDPRARLPLVPMMAHHQKTNMRDHLLAVQEIVTALAQRDFAAIERASGRIGFSDAMAGMCQHMGSGAAGFTDQALQFHHTADTIAHAARTLDSEGVLRALGQTLQTCTSCHAAFKQHVVTQPEWNRLTAGAAPSAHQPQ